MPTSAPFDSLPTGHDEDEKATGPTPLDSTPAGPTPLANKRARRAPDVYAPSLDSLRPFRSALDRRSSIATAAAAAPSAAPHAFFSVFYPKKAPEVAAAAAEPRVGSLRETWLQEAAPAHTWGQFFEMRGSTPRDSM